VFLPEGRTWSTSWLITGKENRNNRRKYYHETSLSTTNSVPTTLQLELGLCEEKPVKRSRGLDTNMWHGPSEVDSSRKTRVRILRTLQQTMLVIDVSVLQTHADLSISLFYDNHYLISSVLLFFPLRSN